MDDGDRLIVTDGLGFSADEGDEGMRVHLRYAYMGSEREESGLDTPMDYYIRLYNISEVLCKQPVTRSFVLADEEHRLDSIGNDPINVTDAWFSGKYLNVEFEVLTGLTDYWALNTPYVNSLSKLDRVMSAAAWASLYDFEPWAMHAYDGTMYKRNIVYPIMGFERFVDENTMRYQEREYESSYLNDWSMYEETLEVLRESEEPQLVNLITMQGHMPFDGANYPELDYRMTRYSNDLMEHNLQSMHMSDQYLGEFLAEIEKLEEPTVVLWYGDHGAAFLYAYTDAAEQAERDLAYTIPYFIYANFELESPYSAEEIAEMNEELGLSGLEAALSAAEARLGTESWDDLPTTSPNCLMNTLYDVLGVEKPALYYLVGEVCEETPILAAPYYWAEDRELKMTEVLHDYELVNYDVLAGKHYWDGE